MAGQNALLSPVVLAEIERAATTHLGEPWICTAFTDLGDRSSHPAALLHGGALAIFAKLLDASNAKERARAELSGLNLIGGLSPTATAVPIGCGCIEVGGSVVLLFEGLTERPPAERTLGDWQAIGHTLAALHQVHGDRFGLDEDGFFGPLHQDNRPVPSGAWAEFYGQRRLLPWLASAVDAGQVPTGHARQIEQIVGRLDILIGPEPLPTLLHGDAQHHNFVSTSAGAVVIDASPYFGHPEIDLALIDYFSPVPKELFTAYAEITPIDPGFAERRELWRLFAYLGVLTVDGSSSWGRRFAGRLADTVHRYA